MSSVKEVVRTIGWESVPGVGSMTIRGFEEITEATKRQWVGEYCDRCRSHLAQDPNGGCRGMDYARPVNDGWVTAANENGWRTCLIGVEWARVG
jgi:hypothetical protein